MAKIDFIQIKKEYLTSGKSLRDLAAEFDVNPSYLGEVAAREDWSPQREETRSIAEQETIKKAVESLSEINLRHTNIWKLLQGESLRKIQTFRDAGELIPDESLKAIAQVLKVSVEGERTAVGLPTQGIKAEHAVEVKDQYEEQLKKMSEEDLVQEIESTLRLFKHNGRQQNLIKA